VFVDNLPPLDPGPPAVTLVTPTQINLQWTVPLDQGVNVAPGATESAGAAGNLESQNWYRVGNVGVQVSRNGAIVSPWGTGTTFNDTGLTANTACTYTIQAQDNNSNARGNWHNITDADTNTVWTLSVAPESASVVPDQTNAVVGSNITWTAVGGFGAGTLQYYRYAWDQTPAYSFNDTEPQWTSGNVATLPGSAGTWYLHVKGYNGADVGNGTFDYAINVTQAAQTEPQIVSIITTGGVVNLVWTSVSGAVYRVQYTPDLGSDAWSNVVPDVQATNSTAATVDDPVGAAQRFYRVIRLP
jgi:hypothetical protein